MPWSSGRQQEIQAVRESPRLVRVSPVTSGAEIRGTVRGENPRAFTGFEWAWVDLGRMYPSGAMILGCAAAARFREPEIQQLYNTTRGRDDVRWFEVSMDDPFCGPCADLHLHDVGHQDGIDFLVLECLEGETLAERLRAGALPLPGWT